MEPQQNRKNSFFRTRIMGLAVLMGVAIIISATTSIVRSQGSQLDAADIQSSYYESYDSEREGDYTAAIEALDAVREHYSDSYTVNIRLGWLHYLDADYEESSRYYQAALKAVPSSLEAKVKYMLPLLAMQEYAEVEKQAYQVLSADDNNYLASLRLAAALRMQQKYETAEKLLNEMLALYPTDTAFLTQLALVKEAQQDYEAADRIFWDVLVLDPYSAEANDYFSYLESQE